MTEHTTDATESADETTIPDVADTPGQTPASADGVAAAAGLGVAEESDPVTSPVQPTGTADDGAVAGLGAAEESEPVMSAVQPDVPADDALVADLGAAEESEPVSTPAEPAGGERDAAGGDLGAAEESEPVSSPARDDLGAAEEVADLGAAEEFDEAAPVPVDAPVPSSDAAADPADAEPPVEASAPAEPEDVTSESEDAVTSESENVVTSDSETDLTSQSEADDAAAISALAETDEAADATATAVTGTPAPASGPAPSGSRPTPRPTPRPVPRPMPRSPQAPAATGVPGAGSAPVAPPQDAAEALHAATFGRVDEQGTVYVREGDRERAVGQFPGASAEEALALYVRRFLDLHAKVVLLETRLATTDVAPKEVDQTLAKLTEELTEPAAVGDIAALRDRLDGLRGAAAERRAAAEAERAAAKQVAVAARTAIVEQAEKIAGTDPERIQWRPAGEQLRVLLDQWKDAQRNGPRIDRPTEEALWKRFSHARTTFDRERRHFFAELEARNASARSAKEQLVAQAEKLSTSTDWGATAGAYRDLMAQWKASGRASRKEDDALWARFRAAQDAFFAARDAASAETDAEFRANLEVKEALLTEAERLVPISDLAAAKAALRSIQDRWDAAGKVPRGDLQRVEARLRAVENAVRDADQSAWTRGNPETRARAEGAAAQLEAAIAGLEADLTRAQAAGNARKIADAQAALDARRAWLEQVRRAAQGS